MIIFWFHRHGVWREGLGFSADGRDGPKQELITSRWYLVTVVLLCVDEGEILWLQLYFLFSFFSLLPPIKREYSLLFCKSGKMVNCGWQVVTSGLSNREEGGS